ncbi:hypothetical protein ACFL5Z_18955, partial [Planctomycetota bacterium]
PYYLLGLICHSSMPAANFLISNYRHGFGCARMEGTAEDAARHRLALSGRRHRHGTRRRHCATQFK